MGFSRQEYWSGLPFPSPGNLPHPEIEPGSPALPADSLPSEPPISKLVGYIIAQGREAILHNNYQFSSLSRVRLFVIPWTCSMPGFPVHHQLPELAQTHVRRVSDAIQPSHPLSSSSPPALNLSQHQGLFQ